VIRILGTDRVARTIADTGLDDPPPAWALDGAVAYVGKSGQRPLLVSRGPGAPKQIDAGAEAFAWAG
jgi:hypothetical protein